MFLMMILNVFSEVKRQSCDNNQRFELVAMSPSIVLQILLSVKLQLMVNWPT